MVVILLVFVLACLVLPATARHAPVASSAERPLSSAYLIGSSPLHSPVQPTGEMRQCHKGYNHRQKMLSPDDYFTTEILNSWMRVAGLRLNGKQPAFS